MSRKIPGSPYDPETMPDFWNHVEPGVRDLVEVLLDKGFRTIGSCEGHPSEHFNDCLFARVAWDNTEDIESKERLFKCLWRAEAAGHAICHFYHCDLNAPIVVYSPNGYINLYGGSCAIGFVNKIPTREEYDSFVQFLRENL